jgi:SPP1 gp7 family putative phage head morphogenesis protein
MAESRQINEAYWKQRDDAEKKWMEQNLKDDAAFNKVIERHYQTALDGIQAKLNAEYARSAGKEGLTMGDVVGSVSRAEMAAYEKEAKELVAQSRKLFKAKGHVDYSDFTKEQNLRMKIYNATMRINRLEYLKSQMGLEMVKSGMAISADLGNKLGDDYINEVKRQAGILSEFLPDNTSLTEYNNVLKIVMTSTNQGNFSQRLWANQDALKARLDTVLTNGLVQGIGPREMARDFRTLITNEVQKATYVTERLARTESARVQFKAQMDSFRASKGDFQYVQWHAEPGACKLCQGYASHTEVDGERGTWRIKDVPSIPAHPNCRCSISAYYSQDELDNAIAEQGVANVNAKSESDGIDVHVNDAMEKVLGKEDSDEIERRLKQAPERMQKMWAKYQDRFEIERYDQGVRPHYSPRTKKVTLTPDSVHAANNSSYLSKYDVVYHEFGHAIDYFEMGKDNIYGKISEKNGLGEAMSKDFVTYRDKLMPEILAKYTPDSAGNFFGGLYIKGVKVTFTKKGKLSLPSARQLAEKQIGSEISSQRNWPVYSDVSDMVEAATKGRVSPGSGHGKKYWSYEGMQSTEAFAEMTSATINNPESLAQIKRLFPNAYNKYLDIVDDIIK